MMRHADPVIDQIIELELTGAPRSPASPALLESDAELLDDMILVGRMYVGSTAAEHLELCGHIRADRTMRQLMQRLRAARTVCR